SWIASLAARAERPPARPRLPLVWNGIAIGSAEPAVLQLLQLPGTLSLDGDGFMLHGEPAQALARVAEALLAAGRVTAWRNEQLAVTDEQGRVLGTVERGVTRLLGIATHAVHLLGVDDSASHWLQLRSLTKPDDPGLWDTLVGGMVPAGESAASALERETQEEAGLALSQLRGVRLGGTVTTRRPSGSVPHGYIVERLTWYDCIVPGGVVPVNRDGEVAEFRRMAPEELAQRLQRDEVTVDAALMLVARGL
ncbi:MAG: NUDIX domain-containing protein, partial [Comamonadaceae bacterium]